MNTYQHSVIIVSPKFSQDLLETQNPTSTSDDIVDVLYTPQEGITSQYFWKVYIYVELKNESELSDHCTTQPNAIPPTILQHDL